MGRRLVAAGRAAVRHTQGSFGPDRITKNSYDAADQLTKVTEAWGTADQADEVTYGYSLNGRKQYVTDANGNKAQLVYDGHDRQSEWRFPDEVSVGTVSASDYEAYGYDPDGNRTSFRNRAGETLTYSYDALNRMTLKDAPAGEQDVAFSYDLRGLQTAAAFTGGGDSLGNDYDNAGRLIFATAKTAGVERALAFQYDGNGNRTRITHPDGLYAAYDYDGLNRLTSVKENGTVTLATLSYDAQGRRLGLARGNGTSASYGHDGAGRLTTLAEDMPGTAGDQALTFAYTPSSQIRQNTRANDAYAWNGHANVSRAYSVNGLNQYTSVGGTVPTYDAKGNLTSAGPATYAYSSENRLTSGAGTAFGYDPGGRLSTIGSSTRLLYDGADLIAEYSASGTLLRRYVHGAGTDDPLVWYEGTGTGDKRWLHSDERGSIVAVSNAAGATLGINRYDEYGVPAPTNLGRFQYTGQTWLAEIGMYHYKARVYDPRLGRFLQVDPIGYDDQFNLYAYVGGDPVNATDPDGRAAQWIKDKLTGSVTLQIQVHFTGAGATADAIRQIQERMKSIRITDPRYSIRLVALDSPGGKGTNSLDLSPGLDTKMCGPPGECVNRLGGDRGHINSSDPYYIDGAVHDILHFAGIKDRYKGGKVKNGVRGPATPHKGYTNDNIMSSRTGTELQGEQFEEASKRGSVQKCTAIGTKIATPC